MPGLKLQVTNAGRAALVNAPNTGTNAVLVAQVGIATAPFAVSAALTVLPNEIKRVTAVGGTITAKDTIHVSIRDESNAVYDCYGFGLYLSDGTLFAVYSQPELLLGKAAAAMMLLALDAVFTDIDVQQLTFGETNFTDPAATTEVPGIVELATETEATGGTDKVRAITAYLLKKVLDARFGIGAPSDFVKGLLGIASAALFRAALELKGAALKDEGDGNGLDADKLDGQHGAYYRAWANLTGVPATASRWPTFAEVTSKPDTYPPSAHTHADYLPLTGGNLTGHLGLFGNNKLLRIWDDNKDIPVIEAGAGYGNAMDRIAWIVNRNAAGPMILGSRNFSIKLTIGSDVGLSTLDGDFQVSGTVVGDAAGNGTVPAFKVGNDAGLWDCNVANAFMLCSLSNTALGHMYFGRNLRTWFGESPSSPNTTTMGMQQYLQENVALGGAPLYRFCDSQHVAYYKRAGTYGFYWRRNSTGSPGGTGEVELMNISDAGKLWTLSGYGWGSSRELKDIIGASPYGLAEVEQMSVHLGRYKQAYNPDGRVRLFLDAEQLLEMMPETVDPEGVAFNGKRVAGVQFDQLLPVAFNAIKQLSHVVRDLQAEVAELRAAL